MKVRFKIPKFRFETSKFRLEISAFWLLHAVIISNVVAIEGKVNPISKLGFYIAGNKMFFN